VVALEPPGQKLPAVHSKGLDADAQ
jgi:hypothetical protein